MAGEWRIVSEAPTSVFRSVFDRLFYTRPSVKERFTERSKTTTLRRILNWEPVAHEGADIASAVIREGRGVYSRNAGVMIALSSDVRDGSRGAVLWLPVTHVRYGMDTMASLVKHYACDIADDLMGQGFPSSFLKNR